VAQEAKAVPRTITIEIPDELIKLLGSEEEIGKEAKQALVMNLVRRGEISRGKAAELLGVSVWDMPELFLKYEIPWFNYSPEQLEQDLAILRDIETKTGILVQSSVEDNQIAICKQCHRAT